MLKSLRLEKGVAGRGVKAIIWGEKKNDLSSGCQQRKRLCLGQRERAWLEPAQAPLRLDAGAGGGGREKVWALAVAVAVAAWGWAVPLCYRSVLLALTQYSYGSSTQGALLPSPAHSRDTEGPSVIASKWRTKHGNRPRDITAESLET